MNIGILISALRLSSPLGKQFFEKLAVHDILHIVKGHVLITWSVKRHGIDVQEQ